MATTDTTRDGGRALRVGELARRTGLTVRTLHHYDESGLLRPSLRSAAGHRLYTRADVARLHQIRALRTLGLPLAQIRELLDASGITFAGVVELQLSRLRATMAAERRICDRLEALRSMLAAGGEIPLDEMVDTIEEMTTMEKYYTEEQLRTLDARAAALGADRIAAVEAEWKTLIDEVRRHMKAGTDPTSEPIRALAGRWHALIAEFTGGDAGIARSAGQVWQQEENVHGFDAAEMRELMGYIQRSSAR